MKKTKSEQALLHAAYAAGIRWRCPHCGTEGWDSARTRVPQRDHARPDGRDCLASRGPAPKGCIRCKAPVPQPRLWKELPERCAECQEDWDRKMADSLKRY